MKLKRTTGLLLSIALMMIPAATAVAKPAVSHHLDMTWSESRGGDVVNGGFTLLVDDTGVATVEFTEKTLAFETCGSGSTPTLSVSTIYFSGETMLETVIDRQLKTIDVVGTIQVERTVASECDSTSVSTSEVIDVSLTGVSVDRAVRTRDKATGVREISRAHEIVLELGGDSATFTERLMRSISSA